MAGDILFDELPSFDLPLPQDELKLLAALPDYGDNHCVQQVPDDQEACCRRLAARGLVKLHRWKDDPIAIRPTMYAGRIGAWRDVAGIVD
ncbi:MAG TPA: hypothetical protein VGF77_08380 [Allosphingosinicella sp.]|jgi:hypothetical protein